MTRQTLLLTSLLLAACSSSNNGGSDAGTGTDAGSGDAGTSTDGGVACALPNTCTVPVPECIGFVDNAGQSTFSLRIAELKATKPAAFSSGIFGNVVSGAAITNFPQCRLTGSGSLNWLLQFDSSAKQLKVGGAKPVSDPSNGFSYVDETVNGLQVSPATASFDAPAANTFSQPTGTDVVLPIYLDAQATQAIILPIHSLKFSGTLSDNNSCIGQYNAAGLDPANSCAPDSTHPLYVKGGQLNGFITLEEADTITISAIGQSLCVLLSGNASTFGTSNGMGVTVCKRDGSNKILFQGDWCSTTSAAADGTCADAASFTGDYAAQSIKVNN